MTLFTCKLERREKKEKNKKNRSLAGCIIKFQELFFTKSKAAAEVS